MTYLFRDVLRSLRSSPIFAFYVLATLVVAGRIGLITFQPELMGMPGMVHFGVPQHRVHDLTFRFLFTTSVVGVLLQFRCSTKCGRRIGDLRVGRRWFGFEGSDG